MTCLTRWCVQGQRSLTCRRCCCCQDRVPTNVRVGHVVVSFPLPVAAYLTFSVLHGAQVAMFADFAEGRRLDCRFVERVFIFGGVYCRSLRVASRRDVRFLDGLAWKCALKNEAPQPLRVLLLARYAGGAFYCFAEGMMEGACTYSWVHARRCGRSVSALTILGFSSCFFRGLWKPPSRPRGEDAGSPCARA